jgi:sugar lactone lactonase YvrE
MINQGDSVLWVLSIDAVWKHNLLKNEDRLIPLHQQEASSLGVMDDRTLLIGFKNTGLWEFSIIEEKLTVQYLHQPDNTSSLLSNSVNDIYTDPLGGLWISAWGKGISYTQPRKRNSERFILSIFMPELRLLTLLP